VAKEDIAQPANLDAQRLGPTRQHLLVFLNLLCRPAHRWTILFRHAGWLPACHLFENGNLAVAQDELHGKVEVEQALDRFAWHRSR
jgi:hypothetical protein